MMSYLRARTDEWSTKWGVRGIILAVAMIAVSFLLDPETQGAAADLLRNLGAPLLVIGLGGILFPERPKNPPECG